MFNLHFSLTFLCCEVVQCLQAIHIHSFGNGAPGILFMSVMHCGMFFNFFLTFRFTVSDVTLFRITCIWNAFVYFALFGFFYTSYLEKWHVSQVWSGSMTNWFLGSLESVCCSHFVSVHGCVKNFFIFPALIFLFSSFLAAYSTFAFKVTTCHSM